MNFLNKKITKIGLAMGAVLLPIVFYCQKGAMAATIDEIMSGASTKAQNALDQSVSFFIATGEATPNTSINVSATSYSFDLNSSVLVWRVNGKIVKQGTGEKTISVTLGDSGVKTKIEVDASTVSGQTYHEETTIIPAAVDLVWQAYTYTPVWYKGKALPSSTSEVKIVAIPYFKTTKGALISASNLVYKWSLNYKTLEPSSGYGKNTLLITMPQLMYKARVEVEVATKDRSIIKTEVVTLESGETKTFVYKNHPTKGVEYGEAVSKTIGMEGEVLGLKVEPFFFALKDLGSIVYNWKTNDKTIDGAEKLNNIVFTKKAEDKGASSVSVRTENKRDFLQTAGNNFLIDFNK